MNNDSFYNSNSFYLIDIFNGKLTKSKINFKIVNNSIYNLKNAKQIEVESAIKRIDPDTGKEYYEKIIHNAFIKSTSNTYSDELDIINSEVAALLNVSASKVFRIDNEHGKKGVISIDVKKNNEQQVNIEALFRKLINWIKEHNVKDLDWLMKYYKIPQNSEKQPIEDDETIKLTIDLLSNITSLFLKLDSKEKESLMKNYIEMIYFDLISSNSVRSLNSYSILVDNKGKFSRLAPIYDYNNDISSKEYYCLNGVFIKKSAILEAMYKYYYRYIKNISRGLMENYKAYIESIDLIIDSNLNVEEADIVRNNYHVSLDNIRSLEMLHLKDYGENKLDLAITKTSINLSAINNNQMVHQKYDKYIKDDKDIELEDTIKIKVEPKKKSKVGKNVFLFIIGLIVLCAIAVGITYFIITYYN